MSDVSLKSDGPRPWTGRTILKMIIAFFFVIGAVNAYFVYVGLKSWPGLVTEHAYDEGVAYNQALAAQHANDALGWKADMGVADGGARVVLVDRDGRPLDGLRVWVHFSRLLGEPHEIDLDLMPQGQGVYAAPAALPLPGRWLMSMSARRTDGLVFRAESRILAK